MDGEVRRLPTVAAASEIGGRAENQDAHGRFQAGGRTFLVLCDGMGGHKGGGFAARTFVGLVVAQVARDGAVLPADPEVAVGDLVARVTAAMLAEAAATDPAMDPHTTAVLCWLDPDRIVVAHVGDSRLYRIGTDGVTWRTLDHSLVQRLVESGELDPREAAHHPYRNAVLRSIGGTSEPAPDVEVLPPLAPGEGVVLCSDGLWEHVRDEELAALSGSSAPEEDLGALVRTAVGRGGRHADNTTALLALLSP
jgi:serine/threonine protein phosphatase PrpC